MYKMKYSNPYIQRCTLRFHRWSRKAFASFLSLGKHVIICHVKASIADASCAKGGVSSSVSRCSNLINMIGFDKKSYFDDLFDLLVFNLLDQLSLILNIPSKSEMACAYSLQKL